MSAHNWSEFSASELLWHYCVLQVSYSHGFCPSHIFCWRYQIHDAAVQQQFLGISGKCNASQNSCAAEPLEHCCTCPQDFNSKAIETQSLTSWHNSLLSEILEKSSKSPHWGSCSSERNYVMCKHGYLLSCKEKCRSSDSSLSSPGKGRCHILHNANLGNAVESHPAASAEQCRKHKALAPRVGNN